MVFIGVITVRVDVAANEQVFVIVAYSVWNANQPQMTLPGQSANP